MISSLCILTSERSGSNLLRKMLGEHSLICAPSPPHLWSHLTRNLPYYGTLDNESNLKKLVSDAIAMTNSKDSPLNWNYDFNVDQIYQAVKVKNLTGVIGALYETYTNYKNKKIWVTKEVNLFNHVHQIRDVYPETKFIFLCRDGRDVACSTKKVPILEQHIYAIANQWREEQLKFIQIYQDFITRNLIKLVRYEDLIDSPPSKLQEICSFIGIDFEPQMLSFYQNKQTQQEVEQIVNINWKNLLQPVIKDNKGKFLKELSSLEIEIFETIAADALEILGYPLVSNYRQSLGRLEKWIYPLQNKIQKHYQKKKLFQEEWRKNRSKMLSKIYDRQRQEKIAIAPPINYQNY